MDFDRYEAVRDRLAPAPVLAPAPASTPLPASATAPAPAASEDGPRFVGGRVREMTMRLVFPVEYRGRTYDAITLRRPDAAEVGRWFERLAEATKTDPEASLLFPVFLDDDGEAIPEAVFEFLDEEDREPLMERLADFLPPRLRRMQASADASALPAGEDTAPKSSS